MNKTTISWCDYTWNPTAGCTSMGPECDNCYAAAVAHRFKASQAFQGLTEITRDAPGWARSVRDQCAAAGVKFHLKQWGRWKPVDSPEVKGAAMVTDRGQIYSAGWSDIPVPAELMAPSGRANETDARLDGFAHPMPNIWQYRD